MSKKKSVPDTSLDAYHGLDQNQGAELKRQIIETLKRLGKASSEQIADFLGKPYDCVWKRCSDLKNEKKIFASDYKVLTKRNRFARQWMLCDQSQPKIEKPEKALSGKSVSDYSKSIQEISKQLNLL